MDGGDEERAGEGDVLDFVFGDAAEGSENDFSGGPGDEPVPVGDFSQGRGVGHGLIMDGDAGTGGIAVGSGGGFEEGDCFFALLFVEDDGIGVLLGGFEGALAVGGEGPVGEPVGEVGKFGQPFFDEGGLGIELFGLEERVEDAEVGLGVGSGGGGPLPASVIAGEVEVEEVIGEIALAFSPIDEEVFGEEHGGDHAEAVVHPAGGVEAAHGGVDEGEAGLALAPGLEVLFGAWPLDVVGIRFKGFSCSDIGEVGEEHVVEVAPDELGFPFDGAGGGAFAGGADGGPDGEGSVAEVDGEAGGSVDGGEVTVCAVGVYFIEEAIEPFVSGGLSGFEPEVGGFEADLVEGVVADVGRCDG